MSDYKSINDYHLLTHDQLMRENERLRDYLNKSEVINLDLTNQVVKLEKEKAEFESCTSRVYTPNKSYKELENKLVLAENSKQAAIDELYETQVQPLEKKIKEYEKALALTQSMSANDGIRIRELQKIIKDQQTIIDYAAGYISACEQFRDKHPVDVKKWLFEGLK